MPSMMNRLLFTLTMPLLTAAMVSHAASTPDAGQLLQQIEKERGMLLPKQATPETSPLPQVMKPPAGETVIVTSFNFKGNTLLKNEALATVVSEYLNRPLTFAELQRVAAVVADYYRQAGWIVRVYLPQQDITEGVVTIQVVEAVFSGATIENPMPLRLKLGRLQDMVERAQPKQKPVSAKKLDRVLLLMDDLPGLSVVGNLRRGQKEGETELVLKTQNEPLFNGTLSVDNTAARSTGHERLTAYLALNSPLALGDQLTASFIHSQGTDYGRLAYTLPVGDDGWRIGSSGSYLHYDLVAHELLPLNAHGTSATIGLDASYPIIRSRLANLYFWLNFDHKQFDNTASQTTTSRYDINNLAFSLIGNRYDKLAGGGANSASLTLTQGQLDLGKLNISESANLNGSYTKLNYALSRQQVITQHLSAYVALSGQQSASNLDSSEKLYLGGANGVRAYPTNEGGGDDGQLINIELRWQLPQNLTLTGFYDRGHIHVNHNNTANTRPNDYTLQGAGLALGWLTKFGLQFKASWAHRIGENPNPAANGNDQDGSLVKNHWWLSATLPF